MNNWNKYFHYLDGVLFWKDTGTGRKSVAGTLDSGGYQILKHLGKSYKNHNIVWEMHYGQIPPGFEVDHINRKRDDNRVENLRLATRQQNLANSGPKATNTSGFKNVNFHQKKKKWVARAVIGGERKSLGYFNCPTLAAIAHDNAVIGNEFAYLNIRKRNP